MLQTVTDAGRHIHVSHFSTRINIITVCPYQRRHMHKVPDYKHITLTGNVTLFIIRSQHNYILPFGSDFAEAVLVK